jgi:hypothetical protein
MNARKATRRPKTPQPEISAGDVDLMQAASDSVSLGVGTLRAMIACFDNDGKPRADAKDVAVGVRIGRKALRTASDALFSFSPDTPAYKRAQPLLDDLWDTAGIVILAGTVLEHGKLPDGDGMICCPIQGALSVAVGRLEKLHQSIEANLAQMMTALGVSVRRHNRKIQTEARL